MKRRSPGRGARRSTGARPLTGARASTGRRRFGGPRRFVGGLRVRLVVTFVLVALLSAVTATALAYRDARTAVLQRTQNLSRCV
nr:hypothetical protein [Streptomyces californicus]